MLEGNKLNLNLSLLLSQFDNFSLHSVISARRVSLLLVADHVGDRSDANNDVDVDNDDANDDNNTSSASIAASSRIDVVSRSLDRDREQRRRRARGDWRRGSAFGVVGDVFVRQAVAASLRATTTTAASSSSDSAVAIAASTLATRIARASLVRHGADIDHSSTTTTPRRVNLLAPLAARVIVATNPLPAIASSTPTTTSAKSTHRLSISIQVKAHFVVKKLKSFELTRLNRMAQNSLAA